MFSRTYTPPTCTLKVTARGLALLTWFGIQRQQRFTLSFDDPRVSEGEHITVKGDRYELDTLHKVVTTYVQEFLNDSPNLPLDMENTRLEKDSNIPSPDSETKIQENTIKTSDPKIVNYDSQPPIDNQNIYVQPRDLLTHDLFLGPLGNKESGTFISLSMLQLYDLAIALDESQTDLQTLPQFQSDNEVKSIPEWLHTAILILITAGLTVGAIKLYNRYAISQQKQEENIATSDATNSDATNNNNQEIPSQTSPTPIPLATPTISPSSLPTPPTNLPTTTIVKPSPVPTPSPLFPKPTPTAPPPNNLPAPDFSSTIENQGTTSTQNQGSTTTFVVPSAPSQTLPQVPPAAPVRPAAIPSLAPVRPAPIPSFAPVTPPSIPSFAPVTPPPIPSLAPVKPAPIPSFAPVTPPPIPSFAPVRPAPIPSFAPVTPAPIPSFAPVTPPPIPPIPQLTPPPLPPIPQLTPPPLPPAAVPNYGAPVQPRVAVQTPPSLQTQPTLNQTSLQDIKPNLNQTEVKPYFDVGSIPINIPKAIDLPPLKDVDQVAVRETSTTVEPSNEEKKSKYTLLDKIPQVAEVREYFEENWEPPSDLAEDLQYTLLLNGDGTVNKVTPINRASVEFYGDTNMPLEEKAFVSNIEGGKTVKIRLVLSRDGGVKTFLESLN